MKDTACRFSVSGTFSDEYEFSLIKATAECLDSRTEDIVPLTFYFLRRMELSAADKETIAHCISLTVVEYGFVYHRMIEIEKAPVSLNAKAMWKEEHEQKALPF